MFTGFKDSGAMASEETTLRVISKLLDARDRVCSGEVGRD